MKEIEEVNNGFMANINKKDEPELTAEEVVADTLKSIKADHQK